jgi:hypothetical protein
MTVHSACAQEKLTLNQTVSQTVTAGGTNKYPIRLNDGEVSLMSRSGTVNLVLATPDGSSVRDFGGPSIGTRNTYAFAAESSGIFSLNIVNPGEQAAIYELKPQAHARTVTRTTKGQPQITESAQCSNAGQRAKPYRIFCIRSR